VISKVREAPWSTAVVPGETVPLAPAVTVKV
jgi:hypothetical protein